MVNNKFNAWNILNWQNYLETLNPHKIKLGLDRVAQVATALQVTQFSCPVITISGTNGKGSCVAILEAILMAAGYRVGAYTSPHLFQFNERIKINGVAIDDTNLCLSLAKVAQAQDDIPLTYFEFTTLAALQIFQHAKLDVLILEVGLGGRLDAVNIIAADVAVITAVDIDHIEWLGHDRESIGREKAGIFRQGKVAICGDEQVPVSVIETAINLGTSLYQLNKDFFYQETATDWNWEGAETKFEQLPKPRLKLQNAATALMVLAQLQQRLPVDEVAIRQGLLKAALIGRFQCFFQDRIEYIFDVAHNPHAARWLAEQLQTRPCQGRTLAVVGMLADKDINATLAAVAPQIDVWCVGVD